MSYLEQFHYQISGQEKEGKLVFLHGLMGFSSNWRRIAKALEDRYQILLLDQRGHGRSFHPPSGYGPEDYAEDLKIILDELGWQKIHLVGHSMGGRNALYFAWKHPERISKLVIEDIGPESGRAAVDRIRELVHAVPVPFTNREEAKRYFETDFIERFKNRRRVESLAQYLHANLKTEENGRMNWRFSLKGVLDSVEQGRAKNHWRQWEELRVPILLIRGEDSVELDEPTYQRMLEVQPGAQGVVIPDAGHWVHFDQPDQFIRTLEEFLSP